MKIQIFKNGKGVIHGLDPKRITCDIGGVLKIGSTKIEVKPSVENIFPLLFNGATGKYRASFTSEIGTEYELAVVTVKGGRVLPPTETALELIELRSILEFIEDKLVKMDADIDELKHIFDTNSLNFLINEGETK